jgi:hypothetical protein
MMNRLEAPPRPAPRCLLCPKRPHLRGLCMAHYATARATGMLERVALPSRQFTKGKQSRRPR